MGENFEITKDDKGGFHFKLRTAEGRTLLRSEAYTAKASAKNGIDSVRKNADVPGRLTVSQAKDGRPYLNLRAANGQVVGTSPMFADSATCEAAIAAIRGGAARAGIVDNA
ncbi:MAG: YegP family protein [Micropruina sp.]|nr:YegP family protein [Micropruina sp.]